VGVGERKCKALGAMLSATRRSVQLLVHRQTRENCINKPNGLYLNSKVRYGLLSISLYCTTSITGAGDAYSFPNLLYSRRLQDGALLYKIRRTEHGGSLPFLIAHARLALQASVFQICVPRPEFRLDQS
jgi:hypothetical protein